MSTINTERVVLYIDSKMRTTGSRAEDFSITLGSRIEKVIEVEIISAEIPYTFYTVNATNNQICWTDAGTVAYTATVTPGNYSIMKFIDALQIAMNAQMAGFTLTYIRETYKITFANATAFNLDLVNTGGTCTMAESIGLTAATASSTLVSPQGIANISGPKYLLIKSTRLTRPKITRPFLNTTQDDVLYKVDVAGGPGDILIEKNQYTNLLKYGVRQILTSIDFQLVDDRNQLIDLNGQQWSISVCVVVG